MVGYRTGGGAAGAKAKDVGGDAWKLPASPATTCSYLKQGGVPSLTTMDDGEEFCRAADALTTLGVEAPDVTAAFRLVAALVHLGDVAFEFDTGDDGGGSRVDDSSTLDLAAGLAGLDAAALLATLTTRTVETRGESYVVRLVLSRGGYSVETSRGDAAAATWIVRGDESRRRRGSLVSTPAHA